MFIHAKGIQHQVTIARVLFHGEFPSTDSTLPGMESLNLTSTMQIPNQDSRIMDSMSSSYWLSVAGQYL
jgi:hypothetical protein